MDIELGDIIVALDMDGPTFIPYTKPPRMWDHIPDALQTLVKEGINGKRVSVCCASFNPTMHAQHQKHRIGHFFFAGRYGAHHDWVTEEGEYPQRMSSVKLLKSEQLRNMLGDKQLAEKLVIFIDDTLANCVEVQKTLGLPCIFLPNEIGMFTPHDPNKPHRGFTVDMIKEVVDMMGDRKKTSFIFQHPL
eukprot:TRINITY_DN7953_c0_g1_i1.p2 TRINITY_DN7953_c0_g1~~TRINITY_DN7953_c0_g1_i1.p2  ORF type:complete len:201 (+),score=33.21 TRINITY_DN7953_c0_g1_i1:34-603(+)